MLQSDLLQFLYELSQNNNRDWFEKNKKRYEATVKKPFEQLVAALIARLQNIEPGFHIQPKDCIHRIYRDTRFSQDKTPYKTHVSAVFTSRGKQTMDEPGYYFHLEFGNLMLGGGAYFLDKEPLYLVRKTIAQDIDAFREVVNDPVFVQYFGGIQGEKNKILPPEFKELAKQEPLLANKQFYFMAEMDPEICLSPDFADYVLSYFSAAKRFNDYFRKALTSKP
ncbi:MAG TPA: DUF2461 domain-containing protein [Saprospiraceae bacterium]|nr:DUF2461 domain-containing protein [Saprospiraceae bacterium]